MNFASRSWSRVRASFWFTPALIVVASMLAAIALVETDAWKPSELARWSPRLFGAGAAGSRAMLSAIATSMATVAGVVFSITIVTLSLTSTQYSPRVLRNFMRDGPTQVVLGVFVGIFAYCLVVLRTIRGGDEGVFIPSLAVLGGMGYAFVGIAVLIYFIHHVAQGIQASSILSRIAADTTAAIDHLFPHELGAPAGPGVEPPQPPVQWRVLPATRSGYLLAVDQPRLLALARQCGRVLRLCVPVGAFVADGAGLIAAEGTADIPPGQERSLRACLSLGSQRTVEQDAAFGLQQLVEVALRALSPGVNDPATACMCIDQLGALLARLARRQMPEPMRVEDGQLRVIAPAPGFADLVALACHPIVRHARGDLQVLERMLDALETVSSAAADPVRNEGLQPVLRELAVELATVRPRARAAALRRRLADSARRRRELLANRS